MPPDRMSRVVDTEIPYIVHLSDRSDWALGEPQQMSNGITWYTDGSKTSSDTGAADALRLSRRELRKVVGFITGQWKFSAHLQKLGIDVANPLCRKCGEAVETAKHVIFDCPALCRRRSSYLEVFQEEGRQVWCSAITKEATNLQIEKDSHSPAQYRVIGALSNLKEFSQEFNCKTGSKMNPGKKCEVW
nr:unnamed protein product [Callosobruchus chinensis]